MDKTTIIEIISGVIMVGLLIFFINPYMFWMPTPMQYSVLGCVLIGFGFFVGMVWREQARDEREELHAMQANRLGYLSGLGMLVLLAVYQALTNMIDIWVFAIIAVMVTVKLAVRIYSDIKG